MDLSLWNLGAAAPAILLIPACGAELPLTGDTDAGTAESSATASSTPSSSTSSGELPEPSATAPTSASDETSASSVGTDGTNTSSTGGECEDRDDCDYGEVCNYDGRCVDDGCDYFGGFGDCIDCDDHEDCSAPYSVCVGYDGYCAQPIFPGECFEGPDISLAPLPADLNGAIALTFVNANDDASRDLVAVVGNSVVVSLGPGQDPGPALAHGTGTPRIVASGDFDGDDNDDIVVATTAPAQLTVLEGDGAGAFIAGPSTPLAANADALAVADFDGSGADDVAITSGGELTVWLAVSGQLEQSVDLGGSVEAVVAAELDDLPGPDLAFTADGIVWVWPGNGSGDATVQELGDGAPFTDAVPIVASARQSSISDNALVFTFVPVADFSQAFLFRNLGLSGVGPTELTGTFTAAEEIRLADAPDTEMVLAAESQVVLLEISVGGISCTVAAALEHSITALAVGDLDGDQVDEVVAVGPAGATAVAFG